MGTIPHFRGFVHRQTTDERGRGNPLISGRVGTMESGQLATPPSLHDKGKLILSCTHDFWMLLTERSSRLCSIGQKSTPLFLLI